MPKEVPFTSVVFCAPSKKEDLSIDAGVGSMALLLANSPIHVVPTMATSGVLPAVMAVVNLSCAASHGMAVTWTLTPGLAASKSVVSLDRLSPSAPIAQTVIVPLALPVLTAAPVWPAALPPASALRPQAVMVRAAAVMHATVMAVVRLIGLSLSRVSEGCVGLGGGGGMGAGCRGGVSGWGAGQGAAQPQEPRMTSAVGRTWGSSIGRPPETRWCRRSAARTPRSWTGWRTVVRPGRT